MEIALLISFIYGTYIFFEVISILPRISGSILSKNALGYSFQNMINTVKRIFIVLYPPFLGYLVSIGDVENIIKSIYLSYIFGIFAIIIGILMKNRIILFFKKLIESYEKSGRLITAIASGFERSSKHKYTLANYPISFRSASYHIAFFIAFIYTVYGSTIFLINLLSLYFIEFSAIILQLNGLISASATLLLAFLIDPKFSRLFESKKSSEIILSSIFMGHILHIFIFGPLLLTTAIFFLKF